MTLPQFGHVRGARPPGPRPYAGTEEVANMDDNDPDVLDTAVNTGKAGGSAGAKAGSVAGRFAGWGAGAR